MRALIQRVTSASVKVDGEIVGKIGKGFLIFLGVYEEDTKEKIEKLTKKIVNLRIFNDENDLEFYGKNKAKINYTNYINRERKGKLILVTAITPTKQGEGKTTMSIGIADGLRIYRKKCYCCTKRAIFRSCIWT